MSGRRAVKVLLVVLLLLLVAQWLLGAALSVMVVTAVGVALSAVALFAGRHFDRGVRWISSRLLEAESWLFVLAAAFAVAIVLAIAVGLWP